MEIDPKVVKRIMRKTKNSDRLDLDIDTEDHKLKIERIREYEGTPIKTVFGVAYFG